MRHLVLITLLTTASLGQSVWAAEVEPLQYNIVNLQAEASNKVNNDEMNVVLFVEKSNKNPAELSQQITRVMNKAIATAKQYPTVKVETGAQSSYPIYDNDNQKLKEWRSRAEVRIESTDFKAASQLVGALQQDLQTQSVSFSVSDAQRKQVENTLMIEASKNFQSRAQSIAQAWNKSQYMLVNLNFNSNNDMPQPMVRASMSKLSMAEDAVTQNVSAGESKITVNASGSIQLK